MDDEHIIFVFGHPVLVMRHKNMSIGSALFINCHAGAARQVQCIHRHRFHGIDHTQVFKSHIRTFGDSYQLVHILRITLLSKGQVLAGLDLRAGPGQLELFVGIRDQATSIFNAMLDLFLTGFPDLAPNFTVRSRNTNQGGWIWMQRRLDFRGHWGLSFCYSGGDLRIISLPPGKQ